MTKKRTAFLSKFRNLWRSAARGRLSRAIACYEVELKDLIKRVREKEGADLVWSETASTLLQEAQRALDANDVDRGWYFYNAAQRMELFGLAELDPIALQSRGRVVLEQAESKLGSWRKKVVEDLLSENGNLKPHLSVTEVFQASQILHEHFDNLYFKLEGIKRQLTILVLVSMLALLAIVLRVVRGIPLASYNAMTGDSPFIINVVLFGFMGASLSGIFSLAGSSRGERIPDQLVNAWISFSRLVAGAVAALVLYSFLASDLIKIGGHTSSWLYLAVAFAAGFSERLLVQTVGKVSG